MRLFSDIKVSENLFIAVIPLFGYIAAFFYEAGRFLVLKVPIEYIQVNIGSILLSSFLTFSILLLVIIVFLVLSKIPNISDDKKLVYILNGNKVTKDSFLSLIILSIFIPVLITIALSASTALSVLYISAISITLFILLVALFFLPPLIQYPNEKNYLAKFDKYQDENYKKRITMAKIEMKRKNSEISHLNLFNMLNINEEHPFYGYIKLTIYSIIWAIFALILGVGVMNTSMYSTTKIENKDYVVLGTYSNNFILVGFDREKKITTNEILLVNNEKNIQLTREEIGIINKNKSNTSVSKMF